MVRKASRMQMRNNKTWVYMDTAEKMRDGHPLHPLKTHIKAPGWVFTPTATPTALYLSHTHSLVSQPLNLFCCNSFDQSLIYTLPLNDISQPVVQLELQLLCMFWGFICQDDILVCSWRVLCYRAGYLIRVSVVDGPALPDTIAIILKWKWLSNYMGNLFSYKYMRQCTSVH